MKFVYSIPAIVAALGLLAQSIILPAAHGWMVGTDETAHHVDSAPLNDGPHWQNSSKHHHHDEGSCGSCHLFTALKAPVPDSPKSETPLAETSALKSLAQSHFICAQSLGTPPRGPPALS